MRYVSPFQELGIELDDVLDKANLNLAKKRLLAELDLSEEVTILRGVIELTKNDVIKQFDALAAINDWDFHQLIFNDKGLLDFLQNRDWAAQTAFLKEPKYTDEAFVEFISPYFLESYKALIIKSISSGNSNKLKALLDISPAFLTDYDYNSTWYAVHTFLFNWIDNLAGIAEDIKKGQAYAAPELASFCNQSFMECLNLLPDKLRPTDVYSTHFKEFREHYAQLIYEISEYFWNQNHHQRAIDLVENARFLNVSFRTERKFDKRIVWYHRQLEEIENPPSESDIDWGRVAKIVIFVVYTVFSIYSTFKHITERR